VGLQEPLYSQPDFYNFPYAFGLLFGLGVYSLYLKQGQAFIADYNRLLAATGSGDIASVCATVGIDVHDRGFWLGSLAVLEDNVNRFAELAARS
jgi:oligoendopeptidase F